MGRDLADGEYLEILRSLSERVVGAQQSIRVLNAVAWDDSIRSKFFAAGCEREPEVTADYYRGRPLAFDPSEAVEVFRQIEDDTEARLGSEDSAARILLRMCREYELVIDMLDARGTKEFADFSAQLYGRSTDPFFPGQGNLNDLARILDEILDTLDESTFLERNRRDIPTERAVEILRSRLDQTMRVDDMGVRVVVDDGIVADAAAGSDYIKLRAGVNFSERDLALLEAHEGWVHVGTTLNGRAQPTCTFLGKGTPATTTTQEGLAVLVEVTSLRSHPARLRRITDRIHGIRMAEQGATFLDVFRSFVDRGRSKEEAWSVTARIYRGGLPTAGPFSKDLSYSKGFVLIYNFLRLAIRRGRVDRIPMLFVGKLVLEEVGLIFDLVERGVIVPPRFMPPVFADPSALVSWMAYSNFLNGIDLTRAESSFAHVLGLD
jgi:uncharacterized protein (TIGR02421 family)